jgi:hypothetical protein
VGSGAVLCDHCVVVEFPLDLLELQRAVLRVEAVYQRRVGELYGHPVMREARDEGRLVQVSAELRRVARAA